VQKSRRIEAISNLSDEEIEKKFNIWDRLQEKGLLSKEEVENKKKEYLKNKKIKHNTRFFG
jgi:hypothetical protein